ncbi:MAG: TerB family tellurite resistance protein [Candidatus Latescibacteria bacterium]|nr:TerB family tellurite resistance protein [Candidatus Latescibacterota bacterium]
MGLLGALFGGTVGFMLGGPLGMIIGGALGSQSSAQVVRTGAAGRIPGVQDAQTAFVVAVISLAAKVSKADGHVSEAEIHTFDAFLRDHLRMSPEDRRMAGRIFDEARDSAIPAGDFARQVRGIMGPSPQRLRLIVTLLLQIAHADGRMHAAEDELIRGIARDLGLSDRDYQECRALFAPVRDSLESAYEALGLKPDATEEEIKKAYRRIAREYHPDILQGKGMPEEFLQSGKEMLQKVNEAYDRIRKDREF